MALATPVQSDIGLILHDRYRLTRELGSGASGAVFEARDLSTRARVAVKLLHRELLASPEHVARFLREARSAANLEHPGVVAFLDAGEGADGRPFLVQEFLHGEDMQDALDARSLGIAQIFDVALQLLDALSAVHDHGLVHRDVKPENIFLIHDEFGGMHAKLVDFGIAKPTDATTALTRQGRTVGTPEYMSPEQAEGIEVDHLTDVWSAGVLLHEALTGTLPFQGDSPMAVMVAVLTKPPPTLSSKRPDLPDWLCHVVDRALERDRSLRWQSAGDMATALRDGLHAS